MRGVQRAEGRELTAMTHRLLHVVLQRLFAAGVLLGPPIPIAETNQESYVRALTQDANWTPEKFHVMCDAFAAKIIEKRMVRFAELPSFPGWDQERIWQRVTDSRTGVSIRAQHLYDAPNNRVVTEFKIAGWSDPVLSPSVDGSDVRIVTLE